MSSTDATTLPDADLFAAECDAFLSSRYSPLPQERAAFVWGDGPDTVPVFEEVDRDEEAKEVEGVRAWRAELWNAGLGWLTGPPELGGRGLPSRYQRILDEAGRRYAVPGNGKLTISLGMVAPTILVHGNDACRQRYLPGLHDGRLIACQLFSEPGAGSDLASVSTKAVRDGDGWRITGQKVWTSGAHYSDIGEVLCHTGGAERHADLTAFVIDMHQPGVEVRPLRQMTGGAAFNEVFLDDAWVPDGDRLGDVGEGWKVAITTLSNERNAIGGSGFGGVGLLSAERYVEMVRAFGLTEDPHIRQQLAELLTGFRVAKLNRMRAEATRRAGGRPGPEASLDKLSLTANYGRISAFVGAVLGPRLIADTGEWGTYSWSSFTTGAPGMRIGGGTDEVMKNVIAERVLGLPKS